MPYTEEQLNRILEYSKQPATQPTGYGQYPTKPTYGEFVPASLGQIGRDVEKYWISATLPMINESIAEENRRENELARIEALSEQYNKRFTSPEAPGVMRTLAKDVVPNIGYSVGMSAPVIGATAAGTAMGGPIGGGIMGVITAAAMLKPGLRSLRRQKMDELERTTRQRIEPILGREITDEEWNGEIRRNKYASLAKKYAAYEVYPELIGSVALGFAFRYGGQFAKRAVTKVAQRVAPTVGKELGEIIAKPGIVSALVGGAGVFTETQLEEQLTELYTNYNQARLDWEHGLTNEPYEKNPYEDTFLGANWGKVGEVLKQQFVPVGLTTITMGGLLGGGATAIDMHNTNKMRRDFKFDNADMRKSAVNKVWNILNDNENTNASIKSAESLRDKYGKEQNPEIWNVLNDMIVAFKEYDNASKGEDISVREKAFNKFLLLRTDEALSNYGNLGNTTETKNDITRILSNLGELEQEDGIDVVVNNATILRENTNELGLTETTKAIDNFIKSRQEKQQARVEEIAKEIKKTEVVQTSQEMKSKEEAGAEIPSTALIPEVPKVKPISEMTIDEIKSEFETLNQKEQAEIDRLNKVAPNRQITQMPYLNEKDFIRRNNLGTELDRRQKIESGGVEEAKQRVAEKHRLRAELKAREQMPEVETFSPADFNKGDVIVDTTNNTKYEVITPIGANGLSRLKNIETGGTKVFNASKTKRFTLEKSSEAITMAEEKIPEKEPVAVGREDIGKTEAGTEIGFDYVVYSANELIPSHKTNLTINPKYPKELQPRDRTRIASEFQVNRIVQNIVPERLGENPLISEGAPVVNKSGIVESGNARTIALQRLYEQNSENAGKYKQYLIDNAEKFGLNADEIANMDNPVLVRRRLSDVDVGKFVREANVPSVASMSTTEQAMSDVNAISDKLLEMFEQNETGEINTTGNREFMRRFFNDIIGTGSPEIGRYVLENGEISQEGVNRIRNAIYAKAYGNPETVSRLSESTDSNIKNITNAMVSVAPKLSILKSMVARGERYTYDITNDIAMASEKLSFLRDQGTTIQEYINQTSMFDEELTPIAKDILRIFDTYKRSSKKLIDIFNNYTDIANDIGNPNQANMFGEMDNPTSEEILQESINRMDGTKVQSDIFKAEAERSEEIGKIEKTQVEKTVAETEREKIEKAIYKKPDKLNEVIKGKPLLSDEEWNKLSDAGKKAIISNTDAYVEFTKARDNDSPALIRDMNDNSSFMIKPMSNYELFGGGGRGFNEYYGVSNNMVDDILAEDMQDVSIPLELLPKGSPKILATKHHYIDTLGKYRYIQLYEVPEGINIPIEKRKAFLEKIRNRLLSHENELFEKWKKENQDFIKYLEKEYYEYYLPRVKNYPKSYHVKSLIEYLKNKAGIKKLVGEPSDDVMYQRRQEALLPDHTTAMFDTFDSVTGEPIKVGDSVWFFEDGRTLSENTFTFLPDVVKQGTLFDMQAYTQSKGKEVSKTLNKITEDDTNLIEQSQNPDTQSNIFTEEELQAMTKDPNQMELFSRYARLSGDYIPLAKEKVVDIVNKITGVFANKPKIEIADNIYDSASKDNLENLKQTGTLGNPNSIIVGFFEPKSNTVYLSNKAMRNESDVVEAVLHETVGHYGLRNVVGRQLEPVLKQAYNYYKTNNPDKLNQLAKLYGLDLEKNSVHRMQASEELLVDAIINPQSAPTIRERAIRIIKNFIDRILKAVGITREIKINSEADIVRLAEQVRSYTLGNLRKNGAPINVTGRHVILMPEVMLENSDIIVDEFNDIVAFMKRNMDSEHPDLEKMKGKAVVNGIEKLYRAEKKKPTIKQNKQIIEARKRNEMFNKKYDSDLLNGMSKWLNATANRNYGNSRKKDIPLIQLIAGSPEFVENIDSFKAFMGFMNNSPNIKRLLNNQMLGEELGKGNALTRLVDWSNKKENKEEYSKMAELWFENDRNKTDYAIEATKRSTKAFMSWFDEQNKDILNLDNVNKFFHEYMIAEGERWDITRNALKKEKFSDEAIDIWIDLRKSYDRALETFIKLGKVEIAKAKKENRAIPTISFLDNITGTSYKINLMDSIRDMGELRGWYAPRLRQPGGFGLKAEGAGLSPMLKFFGGMSDSVAKATREKFKLDLAEQGYTKFEYYETSELPDTFNIYDNILGIENVIEEVLGRMDFTFYDSLDDIKELNTRVIDYIKKDGGTEKHFVIDMDGDKYTEVFKHAGGRRYEEQSGSGNTVWHFENAKNIADKILNGINTDYEARRKVNDDFAIRMVSNIANLIKSGSWRASTIGRSKRIGEEVVRGYEEDLIKASGTYFNRVSAGLAKAEVAQEALGAIAGYYDRTGKKYEHEDFGSDEEFVKFIRNNRIDPIIQKNAYKKARSILETVLAPNTGVEKAMSMAKSAMIVKYLAGTIASPFVNITSMVTSVPASMNHYANVPWKQIPKQLMIGAKYYADYRLGKLKNIPKDTLKLLERLDEMSLDRAQFYNDQLAWLKSKEGAWLARKANQLMWIFEQTERFNRGATIIGTYDYINKHNTKNLSFNDLIDESENISNKAHGIYEKSTAPFWAQGKTTLPVIARGMYTFMKFSHTYLQNMAEMTFAKDKNVSDKVKNVGYMMFAPMVLGGIGAIPLAGALDDLDEMVGNPLKGILNKIFDTDDYMYDFYKAVEENLGDVAADIAHDGVIGAVTPVTVRGSLAVEVPDPSETAPWSLVKDLGYGYTDIRRGDILRGSERLLPRFLSAPIRAYREAKYGATTRTGAPIFYGTKQIKPTTGETALRVLGFSPATVTRQKEEVYEARVLKQKYDDRKNDIYARYKRYLQKPVKERKPQELAKISKLRKEYNDEVRKRRKTDKRYLGISFITDATLKQSLRSMRTVPKIERGRALGETIVGRGDIY